MGKISHVLVLTLLFIVTSNAELNLFSHSLPYTTQPPSHAPAPSPSHHHSGGGHHPAAGHHHPGAGHHHHHAHSPAPSPSYAAAPPHPSKPVTPSPVVAKPPTTTYPTPSVPPTHPPVKPPTPKPKPPTTKPVYPPTVKPPSAAPAPAPAVLRKFVAVEGMVYCKKNCTYSGINTLLGSSPLPGARVVMRCRNTKYLIRKTATTDKNGYYFLQAPQSITTYGAHKCKIYLAHKPKHGGPCSNATDLNNGATGAYLFSNNTGPPKHLPTFSLFSVGPFAYESTECHKH